MIVRLLGPRRLRGLGRIDDDRLIGLLMIRDESDIIDTSLGAATRWFDRILVLDGTTDPGERRRTDEALARHHEVVFVARDEDLPGSVTRDGARQFLLDEARRRFGVDNWIGILHADEFMDQDPRPMLAARHPSRDPSIRVRLAHAFLHIDDESTWEQRRRLPVRERVQHVMWPGVPESRFFFDTGDRDYEVRRHAKVIPRSFRPGPLVDGFVVIQYNERSPEQVLRRAHQRSADGWQSEHYVRFLSDPPETFTSTLDRPESPFAPEFARDPEGPFRPVHLGELARGSSPRGPDPLLLVGDVEPAVRGDRVLVDLRPVVETGGLLDLIDEPSRRDVVRWHLRMRDHRCGWGGAVGGTHRDGYEALLRHTGAVLASPRSTLAHRRTVARELIHGLHDPMGESAGWAASVPEPRLASLRAVLPAAGVHKPGVENGHGVKNPDVT